MAQVHPDGEANHEVHIETGQRSRWNQAVIQKVISGRDGLVQNLRLNASMAEMLDKILSHLMSNYKEQQATDELQLCQVFNERGTLLHVITVAILKPSEHEHLYMAAFDCILWAAANPLSAVLKKNQAKLNVLDIILQEMHVPLLRKVLNDHMCISLDNELDVSFLMNSSVDQSHCLANLWSFYCCKFDAEDPRLKQVLDHALRKDAVDDILGIVSIRMLMSTLSNLVTKLFIFAIIWHILYISVFSYACFDLLDSANNQTRLSTRILFYTVGLTEPVFLTLHLIRDVLILAVVICYCCQPADEEDKRLGWASLKRLVFLLPYLVMLCITISTINQSDSPSRHYIISITLLYGWLLTFRLSFGIESIHFFTEVLRKIIVQNVTKILIAYALFLMGFSLAIHVQFMASASILTSYKTLAHTLFLMFNIMMGMGDIFTVEVETSLDVVGIAPLFSKILYISYLVFVSIILLNLLIAMMNTSYSLLKQEHSQKWKVDTTLYGLDVVVNFPWIAKPFCSRIWNIWTSDTELWIARIDKEPDTMQAVAGEQGDVNLQRQARNMENRMTSMLQATEIRIGDLAEQQSEMKRKINEVLLILKQNTSRHSMNTEENKETVKLNEIAPDASCHNGGS